MANKNRYTVEQVVAAIVRNRGLVSAAARTLGCEDQTVRNYAARYPKVQQAIDDQRERLIDAAEGRLLEAVEKKGEPWAIALVLKTLGKKRGYVERVEQTGADGAPIQHETKVRGTLDFDTFRDAWMGVADTGRLADSGGDGSPESLDTARADAETGGLPHTPA